jgi:hypothetical protein
VLTASDASDSKQEIQKMTHAINSSEKIFCVAMAWISFHQMVTEYRKPATYWVEWALWGYINDTLKLLSILPDHKEVGGLFQKAAFKQKVVSIKPAILALQGQRKNLFDEIRTAISIVLSPESASITDCLNASKRHRRLFQRCRQAFQSFSGFTVVRPVMAGQHDPSAAVSAMDGVSAMAGRDDSSAAVGAMAGVGAMDGVSSMDGRDDSSAVVVDSKHSFSLRVVHTSRDIQLNSDRYPQFLCFDSLSGLAFVSNVSRCINAYRISGSSLKTRVRSIDTSDSAFICVHGRELFVASLLYCKISVFSLENNVFERFINLPSKAICIVVYVPSDGAPPPSKGSPFASAGAPSPSPLEGAPSPSPLEGAPSPSPLEGAPAPSPSEGAPSPPEKSPPAILIVSMECGMVGAFTLDGVHLPNYFHHLSPLHCSLPRPSSSSSSSMGSTVSTIMPLLSSSVVIPEVIHYYPLVNLLSSQARKHECASSSITSLPLPKRHSFVTIDPSSGDIYRSFSFDTSIYVYNKCGFFMHKFGGEFLRDGLNQMVIVGQNLYILNDYLFDRIVIEVFSLSGKHHQTSVLTKASEDRYSECHGFCSGPDGELIVVTNERMYFIRQQ